MEGVSIAKGAVERSVHTPPPLGYPSTPLKTSSFSTISTAFTHQSNLYVSKNFKHKRSFVTNTTGKLTIRYLLTWRYLCTIILDFSFENSLTLFSIPLFLSLSTPGLCYSESQPSRFFRHFYTVDASAAFCTFEIWSS